MRNQRISSVGLRVGEGKGCIQILMSSGALYIHGSYEEIAEFGREITARAKVQQNKEAEPPEEAAHA